MSKLETRLLLLVLFFFFSFGVKDWKKAADLGIPVSESFDFRVDKKESETAESKAQREVVGSLLRFLVVF